MAAKFSTKTVILGLLSGSSLGYIAQPRQFGSSTTETYIAASTTSSAVAAASSSPTPPLEITVDIPDNIQPVIGSDFPDPAIVQGPNGMWWAFGTSTSGGPRVRVASADSPMGPWTHDPETDAKPELAWTSTRNTWAPDVQILDRGNYLLYYSAPPADNGPQCLGAARASRPQGPYTPDPEPLMCREANSGVIDISGFLDPETDRRYITYKIEGKDVDVGGKNYSTPIFIQEVDPADGTTFIGTEKLINWRLDEDGPLIEAPQIIYRNGYYIHFFSSHMFTADSYDTKYAVADNVAGPYIRGGQIIGMPMGGLVGPGGAQAITSEDLDVLVFHGWCNDRKARCMYAAEFTVTEAA